MEVCDDERSDRIRYVPAGSIHWRGGKHQLLGTAAIDVGRAREHA